MSTHSINLAILRHRYLKNRPAYRRLEFLLNIAPALEPHLSSYLFTLDRRLTNTLRRSYPRYDRHFLFFCGEVELCAMSGLIKIDDDSARTIINSLERISFQPSRDVLPRLLLFRLLRAPSLDLQQSNARAFILDLLQLSDDVSAQSPVWSFLASPQHAGRVLCQKGALANLVALAEDGAPPARSEMAAVGFLTLLAFLRDFVELILAAGDLYLQSAIWHQHVHLLDRVKALPLEIYKLSAMLADQPDIDVSAVAAAYNAYSLLRAETEWERPLLEFASANVWAGGQSSADVRSPPNASKNVAVTSDGREGADAGKEALPGD